MDRILFSGLAGGLDALRLAVVPVESLYWVTSRQVVMKTLLGGAGVLFANPGTLQIGGKAITSGLIVSGFAFGDVIDLASVAFSPSGTTRAGGLLGGPRQ